MKSISISVILIFSLLTSNAIAQSQGRDAWSYAGDSIPSPSSSLWTQAAAYQKSAISYNDSSRWETRLTTGHDQFDYQMYRFIPRYPVIDIWDMSAAWTGYGEDKENYDTYLYIWNNGNTYWEELDRKHLVSDGTLNGSIISNIGNYVDVNGYVHIAAAARHYNYAPFAPAGLSASPGYSDVTISWLPATDPENDTVEYYVLIGNVANSGWVNGTRWYYSGLAENSYYTYSIKARDTYSNSESSLSSGSFLTGSSKSSCPFVYIWNGSAYEYVTDLQGAPIGASYVNQAGRDHAFYDLDFNNGTRLKAKNGTYNIQIRETVYEADFFDYAKLVVADVPEGYGIFTDWHGSGLGAGWHSDGMTGKIYNYSNLPSLYSVKDPGAPVSVIDRNGVNVTARFRESDEYPAPETRSDFNYYTMDFGMIEHPEYAKLILYGWVDYHLRNVTPMEGLGVPQQVMKLEVMNETGKWQQVAELGIFMGDLKPAIYDISNIWITDDRRIRIHPAYTRTSTNIIDKVELDDSIPVDIEVTIVNLTGANLFHGGRDEYTYSNLTNRNHAGNVELPDALEGYFYGNFTRYGDVSPLLDRIDDKYVIMRHGDELDMSFPALEDKPGRYRKIFLDAFVWYSMKKTAEGENIFLRDVVSPLPFYGMTKYPYNVSIENYPYDEDHIGYLREWNTRVCEDRVMGTCYDTAAGKEIKDGTYIDILNFFLTSNSRVSSNPETIPALPRSLNTNYVELKINGRISGNSIFNLSSVTTSSSSYITWNNDITSDNRVYYGLNETEVNDLVNGSWSQWNNNSTTPLIRLGGLMSNTTYYYRPLTWYMGTVNDSVNSGSFMTKRPGVWTGHAEFMVSPAGWIGSPVTSRMVNVFAAPMDINGDYIHGIPPEAVIYGNSGIEIARINLNGIGPYYGNFTLPDYFQEEGGYINITNYPVAGEFSVLRWSCKNCHVDAERYPSTFNYATVHPGHTDTGTSSNCDSCHAMKHAAPDKNMVGCVNNCHKPGLTCNECHNDIRDSYDVPNTSVLSPAFGKDAHLDKKSCMDCHGNLSSINPSPPCAGCHPLTGSNLTTVPAGTGSHSVNKTVSCSLCHNSVHNIRSIKTSECRTCHAAINHDNGIMCTVCHGSDPHNITFAGGENCIKCHGVNYTNASPGVKLTFVDISAFGSSIHLNINSSSPDTVNNSDCWTCHFNKDMNRSNIRSCQDCHTGDGISGIPMASKVRTHLPAVTNYSCEGCHEQVLANKFPEASDIASHYALRPAIRSSNYCDYCHGPYATAPFPAVNKTIPAFSHDNTGWNGDATCRTCHMNSSVQADPLANDTSSLHDLTTEWGDAYNGTTMADCSVCHISKSSRFMEGPAPSHDVTGYENPDCYGCHWKGLNGSTAQKLHSVSTGGQTCIICHSGVDNVQMGRHANLNITDGQDNVTDADCIVCHYGAGTMRMIEGAANNSNTYFCEDCHTTGGSGIKRPSDPALIKDGIIHGSADCKWCHIAGDALQEPLPAGLRYHQNGPGGTAARKNCLDCHYYSNLPEIPFHAPGIVHSADLIECTFCHSQADNHLVTPLSSGTLPLVSDMSVTSHVTSGIPVKVRAVVTDDMTMIAAAQYQVRNGATIIIDWTNMTPEDGRFDSSNEIVNASIDTSNLNGTFRIYVKGMASAYKTNISLPYYPLNGHWSSIYDAQFRVDPPNGYINGTVTGNSSEGIAGVIVVTDTGMSATTDGSGFYSLSLTNGTYRLTASKEPEYYPNSSVLIAVTARTSITSNIILDEKPTGNITGIVTKTNDFK